LVGHKRKILIIEILAQSAVLVIDRSELSFKSFKFDFFYPPSPLLLLAGGPRMEMTFELKKKHHQHQRSFAIVV
jgi:hypothetical protein